MFLLGLVALVFLSAIAGVVFLAIKLAKRSLSPRTDSGNECVRLVLGVATWCLWTRPPSVDECPQGEHYEHWSDEDSGTETQPGSLGEPRRIRMIHHSPKAHSQREQSNSENRANCAVEATIRVVRGVKQTPEKASEPAVDAGLVSGTGHRANDAIPLTA